jgi:hypothetical protein
VGVLIFGLAIATEHTELVALRVGERYPSAAVRSAMISDLGSAETDQPRNLLFTRCINWPKIKMDTIFDLLAFWYLDEEQTRATRRSKRSCILGGRARLDPPGPRACSAPATTTVTVGRHCESRSWCG